MLLTGLFFGSVVSNKEFTPSLYNQKSKRTALCDFLFQYFHVTYTIMGK